MPALKTRQPDSQTLKALRHDNNLEDFAWANQQWNISRIRHDIQTGALKPEVGEVGREFIEQYAVQVLAQDKAKDPRTSNSRGSLLMYVDAKAAVDMPTSVLEEPLILLDAGKKRGYLTMDAARPASYVLADGNHRLCKAFHEDRASLPMLKLSLAQAKGYAC